MTVSRSWAQSLEALKRVEERGLHEGIGALIGNVPWLGETNVTAQLRDDLLTVADALPDLIEIAEAGSDFAFCADRDLLGWAGSMDVIKAHERLKAALERVGLVADLKGNKPT